MIPSPPDVLSPREMEYFELTGAGLTAQQTAEKMQVTVATVASYRARTRQKMHVRRTTGLVRLAFKWRSRNTPAIRGTAVALRATGLGIQQLRPVNTLRLYRHYHAMTTMSLLFPKRVFGTLFALVLVLLAAPPEARGQTWFDVLPKASTFRIDGTSTVNSFSCVTEQVSGTGGINASLMRSVSELNERARPRATLAVPVRSFDCGKSRMNEDMYEALQADEHPAITYALDGVDLLGGSGGRETVHLAVRGNLTIAGTTRPVRFIVGGRELADGLYRIQGTTTLRMTDFGVEPPTALLGLVRAHDAIDVHFDLVAGCRLLLAQAAREGVTQWQAIAQVNDPPACVE